MQIQNDSRSPERRIHQMQQKILELSQQNTSLKQQLHSVTQQRNRIKLILQNDPLYHIFTQQENLYVFDRVHALASYEKQQEQLSIYHNQLQAYERNLNLLKRQIDEKNSVIKQQDTMLLAMKSKQFDLELAKKQLTSEIACLRSKNGQLERIIINDQKNQQKMAEIYQRLQRDMLSKQQQETDFIRDTSRKIQQISKSWLNLAKIVSFEANQATENSQRFKEMMEKIKQQSSIMEQMGRELDQRNEEVANLLSLRSKNSPQYPWDQHTILEMIKSTQLRQRDYKDLLKKHQQMVQSLESSLKEKQQLQRQYIHIKKQLQYTKNLREQNNLLKSECERLKCSYQNFKRQTQQSQINQVGILQENQAFHQMMFDHYGGRLFNAKIQEERKKYLQRLQQRESNNLWANVDELINVNKKLRQKLLRSR